MLQLLQDIRESLNALLAETNVEVQNEGIPVHQQGEAYFENFERSGDLYDLELAITSWQRVVDVTPDDNPHLPGHLSNLGTALLARFEQVGYPEDLETAISHSQEAVNLTPDGHRGKAMFLSNLGNALKARFDWQSSLADLEAAVSQYRRAAELTADGDPEKVMYLSNLGNSLRARFDWQGSLADLEEAISQTRKAVSLTPEDHPQKPIYINNLGNALESRFDRHGSLADLQEAILQKQMAADLSPDGHPYKAGYLNNLGNTLEKRFERSGLLADLEAAISQKRKAVDLAPDDHPHKPSFVSNLSNALFRLFERQNSPADLEEAILQQRKAVELTPDGHPNKPGFLNNLGNTSEKKFGRDGVLSDLDDSILQRDRAVRLERHDHPSRAKYLNNLSRALVIRFERLGDSNDLQRALSAARESAESAVASSMHRLQGALLWASCCTSEGSSSLLAFECAINLLPRIAWLGLVVDDQYFLLADVGWTTRAAVEAAILEGENERAVEWAEQGRSIVWQNLLGLRTPLDRLRCQYPELATRLQDLSHHLERLAETRSTPADAKPSDTTDNQMTLAIERDGLIERVRSKPGFENFMRPKPFRELAPAVREGPVVFLNLGQDRCDALALLSDDRGNPHVVPIPLERVTLQNAEELSKKLVELLSRSGVRARDIRKHKVHGTSDDKDAVFKEILKTLWLDYVEPILDGLAYQVNLDYPPRLWWCTTGPLAFLPLHAAGLYGVKEAGHKASDYVVSSYTPTVTALLDKPSPVSSNELKILTVAISNTPGAPLPCTTEEAQKLRGLAANLPVVSLTNEEATQNRVLEELERSNWAHLACHGEQVGGKPMESGLILHDGKLELSNIVKARLPNADFAFLSACQTAVGDGGVPEESAHLAAGMLFAGYRGVAATMWSIQDDIAPRVAEEFYRYMFRNGKPKRKEAAYALHGAVKSIRESGVPFTSWVPFIHLGR